jgi:hypothetical protein
MTDAIALQEQGRALTFSFDDLLRFHGGGSPGGVAHGFQVLARALPLLGPDGTCERREVFVRTAFGGPGARDACECALRAVSDERYLVDPALARPQLGITRERFVFCVAYREREVTLVLRDGYVTEEFIALARSETRSEDEDRRLTTLKWQMAERVMASPADEVYDAT